ALALVLAGAGVAAVGGTALTVSLAGVGAGALHALAGVLLPLFSRELVTTREHANNRRGYDETQSLLPVHASDLHAEMPTLPPDHHDSTGGGRSIHRGPRADKPGAGRGPALTGGGWAGDNTPCRPAGPKPFSFCCFRRRPRSRSGPPGAVVPRPSPSPC